MLGDFQNSIQQINTDSACSSDEEEITGLISQGIDPIFTTPVKDDSGEMTEEQKEEETERLLDLLERLEKTGIVKVLSSDNQ